MKNSRKRKPQPDDQEKAEKAFQLINHLVKENEDICANIWVSAVFSCVVNSFIASDVSYDDFKNEMEKMTKHYKSWFEDEVD